MVAALWDNDGDFSKEKKDHHQSVLFVSPNRLAKRDAQTSYPIGNSGGGRVELNAVLVLTGHKANIGRDSMARSQVVTCEGSLP